jgi:hypothetical protein
MLQWLRERATVLGYTYIAYLVTSYNPGTFYLELRTLFAPWHFLLQNSTKD